MKKLIALGMSGGVDSSMALEYLKKEWDTIVGANHLVWHDVACSSEEVISRARELCKKSGIPFYCLDVSDEFRARVADNFVCNYTHGLTPNPCVICNQTIKFTFFYDKLKEKLIADGIMNLGDELFYSTGHYVRLISKDGRLFMAKARDASKDQSYMLARLTQEEIANKTAQIQEYNSLISAKQSELDEYRITNRGGKGVKTMNLTDKTGPLVGLHAVTDDEDLMLITKSGTAIRMDISTIRVMGRATQGVKLIELQKRNDTLMFGCIVPKDENDENEEERNEEIGNEEMNQQ